MQATELSGNSHISSARILQVSFEYQNCDNCQSSLNDDMLGVSAMLISTAVSFELSSKEVSVNSWRALIASGESEKTQSSITDSDSKVILDQ